MSDPRRSRRTKVTLLLDESLVGQVRAAVESGAAPSQSALVQEAVVAYVTRLHEDELRRRYAEAARDPLFLADVAETMEAFADADLVEDDE